MLKKAHQDINEENDANNNAAEKGKKLQLTATPISQFQKQVSDEDQRQRIKEE